MHFYVSHRPSIQHGRSTALASSLVALPASLGLLRPVSATGGGLRAPLRFACAVFRIFAPPSPYGGAVFRRCGRPLGVSSRLQPLRGLRLRTSCARHFSPSGLRCSQAHSRLSLPYWGLRTGLRFAGPVFRGCGALRAVPQFSMVVPLRSQARLRHSLLHWAYFGLFRALRAASVRPSPLHPFGASTTTACFRHRRRPSCAPQSADADSVV